MVMCQPAAQFGCGCTVKFGVQVILVLSLLRSLFFVATAFITIFTGSMAFSLLGSMTMQTTWAAYSLAGIPLALVAMWGVQVRGEVPIRLFLYYAFTTFVIDEYVVVQQFVVSGPCDHLPASLELNGAAFACGAARIVNTLMILFINVIELYWIYVVWSYCEDLAAGGAGPDFMDLVSNEQHERLKLKHIEDYIGSGAVESYSTYGILSDNATMQGMSESQPLWGRHHEMQYPPPSRAAKNCTF